LGIELEEIVADGSNVKRGDVVMKLRGNPKQIALAEDVLIALLSKTSGIATAASKAARLSGGDFQIVCGGWRKMPIEIKEMIRDALIFSEVGIRITDKPFVYLDKNYVRIFGGITGALVAANKIKGRSKVIQLRGETKGISEEAVEAIEAGANILMVDTGNLGDVEAVVDELNIRKLRNRVKIAFAGGVKLKDIRKLREKDIDIVEIGREIIDAPLLDMTLDVVEVQNR